MMPFVCPKTNRSPIDSKAAFSYRFRDFVPKLLTLSERGTQQDGSHEEI